MHATRRKSSASLQLEIDDYLATVARAATVPALVPQKVARQYRMSVAYPADLEQAGKHFGSGCNQVGDVRGFVESARNFGVVANRCSPDLLAEIERVNGNGGPLVLVDSGAFSEIKKKKLIPDAEWRRRLGIYLWIATRYHLRAYLIAPDKIGDQQASLARLARYALEISACAAQRANIIVPVVPGAMPMSEFYRQACDILGLRTPPIAGAPFVQNSTSLAQLAELLESLPWFGARIHLLGLGPRSPRWKAVIATIKRIRPNASITSDSVLVRSLSGRTNGPKGTPRAITRYSDEAQASGIKGSTGIRSYAISKQGFDAMRLERAAANKAGWYDTELYDSAEEAAAHAAAGHPED